MRRGDRTQALTWLAMDADMVLSQRLRRSLAAPHHRLRPHRAAAYAASELVAGATPAGPARVLRFLACPSHRRSRRCRPARAPMSLGLGGALGERRGVQRAASHAGW